MTEQRNIQDLRGSVLPDLTNRWLKVNDTKLGLENTENRDYSYDSSLPALPEDFDQKVKDSHRGMSKEFLQINKELANYERTSQISYGDHKEINLSLQAGNNTLYDRHYVLGQAGHVGSLTINTQTLDEEKAERNGLIFVDVEEDAEVSLIIVNRFNDKSINNLSIIADIQDGGALKIIQVELGSALTNFNYAPDLLGDESETLVETAYIADGDQELDLFYDVKQIGYFTNSDIQVNGALLDQAKKSFRGTIDFLKGSKGSTGNEEEFAILMSDDVNSIAVPLLLAGEHDVEGNHAATAGRIDEDQLFYLMSRGFTEKEAEALVIEARMTPALDHIPNEDLREQLGVEIHERIVNR